MRLVSVVTRTRSFFVSRWWLAFTAFVGLNLFQYGFTNFCPIGWILRRAGVPETTSARC
jgi:hypothetical protein